MCTAGTLPPPLRFVLLLYCGLRRCAIGLEQWNNHTTQNNDLKLATSWGGGTQPSNRARGKLLEYCLKVDCLLIESLTKVANVYLFELATLFLPHVNSISRSRSMVTENICL